jgi:YjbE family integral membrane protein
MEVVSALLSILLIDLVLSGDNAVVIGMAAHRLPERQRSVAIMGGAGAAVALRIVLTVVASYLLRIPFLQFVGGAVLLWIAFKLLHEEEETHGDKAPPGSLRDAIVTIVVADAVMSLDNVLGVAGAAHGETNLLLFGLVLSMGLVMFGGSLVATLINKFWWLSYLATAVIAWTGADMIIHDHGLDEVLFVLRDPHYYGAELVAPWVVAVAIVTLAHWFHRRRTAAGTTAA